MENIQASTDTVLAPGHGSRPRLTPLTWVTAPGRAAFSSCDLNVWNGRPGLLSTDRQRLCQGAKGRAAPVSGSRSQLGGKMAS